MRKMDCEDCSWNDLMKFCKYRKRNKCYHEGNNYPELCDCQSCPRQDKFNNCQS